MYDKKKKMGHGGKARKEMMGGGMYGEKRKPMKKGRMVYGMGGEVMPQAKPN